ncbi:MAG: pilus assembly protein [Deltaproteobacteria bacterium]|nr:pilus assembly protein [Deltaproteobacteria bacterium]
MFEKHVDRGKADVVASEGGAVLLEFVISAPFVTILLIGVLDIGQLLSDYLVMTQVAREGVRYASGLYGLEATISENDPQITMPQLGEAPPILQNRDLVIARVAQLLELENTHLESTSRNFEMNLHEGTGRPQVSGDSPDTDVVEVRVSGVHRGFLPLFDKLELSVSQIGPYLY